ncbi:putative inactive purple acid phosphatase 9 [Quercus suber]|uniref:Inactive purple acid phosphatase 9 n=1 Tax=Quercus suber TaxID=58331 RepID=A0AAW0KP32_QUESU
MKGSFVLPTLLLVEVGSDAGGWSSTHSFVSRNEVSDETIAFLFGDTGTAIAYNTFSIEPVASKVAYHVCIGNHKYDWPSQPWRPEWSVGIYGKDGGGKCGVPFSIRFRMLGNSLEPTGT